MQTCISEFNFSKKRLIECLETLNCRMHCFNSLNVSCVSKVCMRLIAVYFVLSVRVLIRIMLCSVVFVVYSSNKIVEVLL